MNSCNVSIRGMHCKSCELLIEKEFKKIPGVTEAAVSYKTGIAKVAYTGAAPAPKQLERAVIAAGYTVGSPGRLPWLSRNPKDYYYLILGAAVLWMVYGLAKITGILNYTVNSDGTTGVAIALVVGLVAGVSTCMALVGGLVLAFASRHAELHPEATPIQKFRPHLFFNAGRVAGFFGLGGAIGGIGSVLKPSPTFLGIFTILVGGIMLILGLKLIEVFPRLAAWQITLPKGIARALGLNKETKKYSHQSTFVAGVLSFFLPCGFTQAMQLYAVSTGNFWQGALVMGLFAIGTAPGLLSLGGLSAIFKGGRARVFFATSGLAVILLGWFNITNGRQLLNGFGATAARAGTNNDSAQGAQIIRMNQVANGYRPSVFTVRRGQPVKWIINSQNSFTCASFLVVPRLGINAPLKLGENIVEFTPSEIGEIPFSCSMGMFRGKIIVE